jgi:hypothetical protein
MIKTNYYLMNIKKTNIHTHTYIYIYMYTGGVKKMYTHFKIYHLCTTSRSWITVTMSSRTFTQTMALIEWMLASPCNRQDSQRKWRKHGCHSWSWVFSILIQFFSFLKMYTHFNCASAIFFDCPACHTVMLAFIWLMPSFEQMSYYSLLP